jgi:hypothetical protein
MSKSQMKLALITAEQSDKLARVIVSKVIALEKAKVEMLKEVAAVAKDFGPITAKQYSKQLASGIVSELKKAQAKRGWTDGTVSNYASKCKTVILAIANKVATPLAGETFFAFCERVAEPLTTAQLADGSGPVWDTVKTGRPGKAKGTASAPSGGASGPATGGTTHGATGGESGLNVRRDLAAALILAKDNKARAARLVIVAQSYGQEFDKWVAGLLTDKDKAEAATMIGEKDAKDTATAPKAATAPTVSNVPDTALADALIKAQAKANRSRRSPEPVLHLQA